MNPFPQAVMLALSICNQHIAGFEPVPCIVETGMPIDKMCPATPIGWDPGYESCKVIYAKTEGAIRAQEEAKEKREEAVRRAKELAQAKADQPKLQAALKALGLK